MPKIPGLSDIVEALQAQTQAFLGLPETLRHVNALARDAHSVVRRLDGLLDDLEEPLRALGPGLHKLGRTLEGDELGTLLAEINDTHRQVAAIATTTGRIMGVIDDVGSRLGSFPGAPLLAGRRRPKAAPD
jgi:cobalamin biosynthesis Mg chelatase CobN